MSTFGKLSEFDANKEDWNSYVEQLDFLFVENSITSCKKDSNHAELMCVCYKLFRGLTQPDRPEDKTYEQLVLLMKRH